MFFFFSCFIFCFGHHSFLEFPMHHIISTVIFIIIDALNCWPSVLQLKWMNTFIFISWAYAQKIDTNYSSFCKSNLPLKCILFFHCTILMLAKWFWRLNWDLIFFKAWIEQKTSNYTCRSCTFLAYLLKSRFHVTENNESLSKRCPHHRHHQRPLHARI